MSRAQVSVVDNVNLEKTPTDRPSQLGLAAAVMATIAISLVAIAMVFAIATGTTETAERGQTGILSEASLSAAAATRNGIVQAQVLAEANELGIATAADLDEALRQAESAAEELAARVGQLLVSTDETASVDPIRVRAEDLVAQTGTALELIRAGDLAASATLIDGELDGTYLRLAGQIAAVRDAAMARIALAGQDSGRIADATRFLVVLLVPLAVLLAYRKRVNRDRVQRDLEHRLEKQQAVSQAQDEFIANLSHELRTPLTAIYGFSLELIEPGSNQDAAFERELATYIASESADLSRMVEDILTAASADQDGLVIAVGSVDVDTEIESVLGPMRATGAKIESDIAPATIKTDPLRFRQVVRNLVSNALRHGGPSNLVAGRVEGDYYTLQVRDDGPGIPAALENRLFTRFIHKGNEPLLTGSVGLGLAIVQLLTTRTGGTISYHREHGETVFSVKFPLISVGAIPVDAAPARPRLDREPSDPPPGTRPPTKPDLKTFAAPPATWVE
ncbi:MAG: HAMP domain-containing histidine kinase [bacterium]|nr:HAMP domain-containing histidine kinase [bacterium]MCP4966097.1 HAMP domain-containing histidine kinase [bacterium]